MFPDELWIKPNITKAAKVSSVLVVRIFEPLKQSRLGQHGRALLLDWCRGVMPIVSADVGDIENAGWCGDGSVSERDFAWLVASRSDSVVAMPSEIYLPAKAQLPCEIGVELPSFDVLHEKTIENHSIR